MKRCIDHEMELNEDNTDEEVEVDSTQRDIHPHGIKRALLEDDRSIDSFQVRVQEPTQRLQND